MIKDMISRLFDAVVSIAQMKNGKKFMVTVSGMGAVTYLAKLNLAELPVVGSITVMVVSYLVVRFLGDR